MASNAAIPAPVRPSRIPLTPLSMAIPVTIFGIAGISIPVATATAFSLSTSQTSSLIITLWAFPGIASLMLATLYRQPLLIAWHGSALIFVTALAGTYTYPEVLGGTLVAGLLVLLIGIFGISRRLVNLLPASIVFGMLAGTLLPFVVRIFSAMDAEPVLIAVPVAAYLLSRRFVPARIPAILIAVLTGLATAALLGNVQAAPHGVALPTLTSTMPSLSWRAVITISPVVTVLIAVQSNLTTIVYLRSQQYHPPERLLDIVTGVGTAFGSLFGAAPISAGSAVIPVVAGPEAGEAERRYWSVYGCGVGFLLIALGAGMAADLPTIVPLALLLALAGLVLIGVLSQALDAITAGPLKLAPLFAFVVALSELSLFGLGAPFWALIVGMAVAYLLEHPSLKALQAATPS